MQAKALVTIRMNIMMNLYICTFSSEHFEMSLDPPPKPWEALLVLLSSWGNRRNRKTVTPRKWVCSLIESSQALRSPVLAGRAGSWSLCIRPGHLTVTASRCCHPAPPSHCCGWGQQPSPVLGALGTGLQKAALREARPLGRDHMLTSLSIIEFFRASTMSLSSVTESLQPLRYSRSSLYSNYNRRKAEEAGKGCQTQSKMVSGLIPRESSPWGHYEDLLPGWGQGFPGWVHCKLGSSSPAPRPGQSFPGPPLPPSRAISVWAQPCEIKLCGQVYFLSLPLTLHNPPVLLGSQTS